MNKSNLYISKPDKVVWFDFLIKNKSLRVAFHLRHNSSFVRYENICQIQKDRFFYTNNHASTNYIDRYS